MPVLALLISMTVLAGLGFCRAWRSRRRLEFRARLFEVISVACRRGRPLLPLLAAAGREHEKREQQAILVLHGALEGGAPLSSALASAGPRFFGPDIVGAVRAAEGTKAFYPTLAALAEDDGRVLDIRHRLYLVALYPAVLVLLAAGLHVGVTNCARVLSNVGGRTLGEAALFPMAWLAAGSAAAWFVGDWLYRRGRLPGGGLLSSARVLRTAGLLSDAGLPLPEALRQAAPATRNRRLARCTEAAAVHLEQGGTCDQAWTVFGLPRSWLVRLRVAPATGIGPLLRGLADRCLLRYQRRGERLLRWVLPVALLVVGVLVLTNFDTVMATLLSAQEQARLGPELW